MDDDGRDGRAYGRSYLLDCKTGWYTVIGFALAYLAAIAGLLPRVTRLRLQLFLRSFSGGLCGTTFSS